MTRHVCPCIGCEAHTGSCPTIVDKGRCPACRAVRRQQRGTTTEQGLGWQHQQRRAHLIQQAIGTNCPDCGDLMTDPTRMVADHSTPRSIDPTSVADRVHCRPCSDRQGGQLAHPGGSPPPLTQPPGRSVGRSDVRGNQSGVEGGV